MKYLVVERYADNGEFSHYDLINTENGETAITDIEETLQLRKADVSVSTSKQKPIWTDYLLNRFRWYRKWRKCTWYKHQFTSDALELSNSSTGTWWALYGKINRYSDVIDTEVW